MEITEIPAAIVHSPEKNNTLQFNAGFHMIATYAAIAGKNRSAIVVIIWKPYFSDRSDHNISQRSQKSGSHMIATIAERFYQRS